MGESNWLDCWFDIVVERRNDVWVMSSSCLAWAWAWDGFFYQGWDISRCRDFRTNRWNVMWMICGCYWPWGFDPGKGCPDGSWSTIVRWFMTRSDFFLTERLCLRRFLGMAFPCSSMHMHIWWMSHTGKTSACLSLSFLRQSGVTTIEKSFLKSSKVQEKLSVDFGLASSMSAVSWFACLSCWILISLGISDNHWRLSLVWGGVPVVLLDAIWIP